MTAKEIIQELEKVAPNTVVTVATNSGSCQILGVRTMGYTDNIAQIEI